MFFPALQFAERDYCDKIAFGCTSACDNAVSILGEKLLEILYPGSSELLENLRSKSWITAFPLGLSFRYKKLFLLKKEQEESDIDVAINLENESKLGK